MNKTLFLSIIFLATLSLILIQCSKSPYVGQELREIKSLSSEEIEEYLEGQGMGLAKAAELNNYPGPIHVLELAGKLQLSKDQIAITEVVYDEMHKEAVRLGKLIVKKERELDTLFIQQSIDEIQLSTIISEPEISISAVFKLSLKLFPITLSKLPPSIFIALLLL